MRKIGVLTSGGDSPGMNAAIRAVHVAERINQGGTFLGSARFPEFKDEKIRQQAIKNLDMHGIEALVIIGGDGSYRGAKALTDMGYPCIGVPGTIDNDIAGTDYTIGYMTALDTILDAVDRLRDTSSSHQRISIIEVMGRYCGDLAISAAVAAGCEYAITPETGFDRELLIARLKNSIHLGKKHAIVILAEHLTDVNELAHYVEKEMQRETRATILGHIQRGGKPTGFDRILASQMGNYAVDLLLEGVGGRAVGIEQNQMVHHDIIEVVENKWSAREDLITLAKTLY